MPKQTQKNSGSKRSGSKNSQRKTGKSGSNSLAAKAVGRTGKMAPKRSTKGASKVPLGIPGL